MLTRTTFASRFAPRAVFGMVHLRALPGAPLFEGSIEAVIDAALRDARALVAGGCHGVLVENFGDRPFFSSRVPAETIAAMTRAIVEIAREVKLPIGVNVLRNDAHGALAVARATGAQFIRVNVHTGAMLTDQGIIEGEAAETLRLRGRSEIAIFADVLVKHAVPLGPVDPVQAGKDLRLRGLADAIVVTGAETGGVADPERLSALRAVLGDAPLIVGSGLTEENAAAFDEADAAIVGTSLKTGGVVDEARVGRFVRTFERNGRPL